MKAKENKISCYLLKPINEKLLVPNIEVAVVRNKELTEYKNSIDKANEQLASRKTIEKAKGLLMKHRNKSEEEAFHYIRDISKKRNMAMVKVAEMMIDQYENNINGNAIENLCREYTKLTDEEIEIIQIAAKSLPAMASMFDADAFIDCPLEDGSGNAIVVAEARPVNRASSYQNKVVGLVATKEKEPAVCRTFQLAVPTKFMKAVTQENEHVVQTVEPILSVNGVIGVFIVEQRMDQVFFADSSRGHRRSDGKVDAYHGMMDAENDGTNPIADNIDEGVLFIDQSGQGRFPGIWRLLRFTKDWVFSTRSWGRITGKFA